MELRAQHSHHAALDAGRGIAAIAVLLYHAGIVSGLGWLPRSFLAVDYFFLLSGFVIAGAYEDRLRDGRLSMAAFLKMRIVRLAPCALLGMALGAFGRVAAGQAIAAPELSGIFLLPALGLAILYPLNMPVWSLLLEACANVLHAVALSKAGLRTMAAILLVLGLFMLYMLVVDRNVNVGPFADQLPRALVRVLFGYVAGVMFWRYLRFRPSGGAWISMVAIAAVLLGVFPLPDLVVVTAALFVIFPMSLVTGLAPTGSRIGERLFLWLGAISYPLYAIHFPLLVLGRDVLRLNGGVSWAILSAFILATAWLVDLQFDRPIRLWLRQRRTVRGAVALT